MAEAVITQERTALDWIENGVRYHLLAHSRDDALTYQGNYGMFRPEEQLETIGRCLLGVSDRLGLDAGLVEARRLTFMRGLRGVGG